MGLEEDRLLVQLNREKVPQRLVVVHKHLVLRSMEVRVQKLLVAIGTGDPCLMKLVLRAAAVVLVVACQQPLAVRVDDLDLTATRAHGPQRISRGDGWK